MPLFVFSLLKIPESDNIIPSWLTQSSGFKAFAGLVRFICLLVNNFNPSYLLVLFPFLLNSYRLQERERLSQPWSVLPCENGRYVWDKLFFIT